MTLEDGTQLMVITDGAMKGRIATLRPVPQDGSTVQLTLGGGTIAKMPGTFRPLTMADIVAVG